METNDSHFPGAGQVTPAQLLELAELARLEISADELPALARDLERILAYVAAVDRIAPTGAPEAETSALPTSLRPDQPVAPARSRDLLAAAPAREDDFFIVPAILPPAASEEKGD